MDRSIKIALFPGGLRQFVEVLPKIMQQAAMTDLPEADDEKIELKTKPKEHKDNSSSGSFGTNIAITRPWLKMPAMVYNLRFGPSLHLKVGMNHPFRGPL